MAANWIKKIIGDRYLKNELRKHKRRYSIADFKFAEIKKIAVYFDANSEKSALLFVGLIKELRFRKIEIHTLGFKSIKGSCEAITEPYTAYNEKDCSRWGIPQSNELLEFIYDRYDVFFELSGLSGLQHDIIQRLTDAKLKVAVNPAGNFADVSFAVENAEASSAFRFILDCLSKINSSRKSTETIIEENINAILSFEKINPEAQQQVISFGAEEQISNRKYTGKKKKKHRR